MPTLSKVHTEKLIVTRYNKWIKSDEANGSVSIEVSEIVESEVASL